MANPNKSVLLALKRRPIETPVTNVTRPMTDGTAQEEQQQKRGK